MATALREVIPDWSLDEGANLRLDQDLLARAYRFSEEAHRGQTRNSGEPYVTHCVEVAKILADLQLDTTTVASGLIHDVVEDTAMTVADVEREFGKEIAAIVDGLTKIAKLPNSGSNQDRQVESYRKLLLSIAKDARVIIVKLADRLHNMRTLDFLPEEKRRRIAQETRDLYAPLAHRFGMAKMRWELEDLAFKHLETEDYKALARKVTQKRAEREALILALREPLGDKDVEEVVRAYVRAFEREDIDALVQLLAQEAVPLGRAGTKAQLIELWRTKIKNFEYQRLAGVEIARFAQIERFGYEALAASGGPQRPTEMRPGDLYVRVPIATPRVGTDQLFGDILVLLLRREDGHLHIAGQADES